MKIAFTHNLRLSDTEEEAEFDSADTVGAIAAALQGAGHEVERIEASGGVAQLVACLEAAEPDLVFNTAEGGRGKVREALFPALFEELGYSYTGSDPYVLTLTLDKWLTKLVLDNHGIDSPRGRLVTPQLLPQVLDAGAGLSFPVIVKPNYEGSSKGIDEQAVARSPRDLADHLRSALEAYPAGVMVEEFVPGTDVTVGFLEGAREDGILAPVDYVVDPSAQNQDNIYGYRLKNLQTSFVQARCPADIPRDVAARLRVVSQNVIHALGLRDFGRIDYRLGDDGRIYLLEVNALPSLELGSALCAAAAHAGMSLDSVVEQIVTSAAVRWKLAHPEELSVQRRKRSQQIRVGFAYNMKRSESSSGNDTEAEYDPPETIAAISDAIASYGHAVVHLEATPDLPLLLAEADVDLVFNIAEGMMGRNREAQVPALCELLNVAYTGSDSATLAVALGQGAHKEGPETAQRADPGVPAVLHGAREAVPRPEVPGHREAQRRGVVQGDPSQLRVRRRGGHARGRQGPHRPLPAAGPGRGVHSGAGVHGGAPRRQAPPRAAAHGDLLQGQGRVPPGVRLHREAGVGEARRVPLPGRAVDLGTKGAREGRADDVSGARLPRRGARGSQGRSRRRDLRARGEPASGSHARLLGPGAHLEGGRNRLPDAHRRDPRGRAQAHARETSCRAGRRPGRACGPGRTRCEERDLAKDGAHRTRGPRITRRRAVG